MPADKTLLVLFPNCIAYEPMLAAELLHPHLPVEVATPDGEHVTSSGIAMRADLAFADARAADYRAVLVPGGDVEAVFDNEPLFELLRDAHSSGAILGAVCAGPLLLAKADLLKGRRFTHGFKNWHTEFLAPFWHGATFVDELVVRDGRVMTAMAEGHVDFAIEMLAALDLLDTESRERKRQFYKGVKQAASEPPPEV